MTRGKVLLWLLAALFVPPAAGTFGLFVTQSPVIGLILYGGFLLGGGFVAASACNAPPVARIFLPMAIAFGMLVVQCTVVFAGCAIILSSYH